jgi:hypothetical protein
MIASDPTAVVIDWLDAYRAGRINQIVGMHSPDAMIDLQVDGGAVVVTYRTNTGIVEALLDIADDGLITCCCCGPVKAFT